MFVFLSKLLPLFVYPVGLAVMLILLALLLGWGRTPRWGGWRNLVLLLALLCLVIGGNRWVALGLTRSLEWQYLPPDEVPHGEVIVVLSGGTAPADYPRSMVEVDGAGDRVLHAAQLYRQGKAPHILLTGGLLDWSSHSSSPTQEMAQLLEFLGVPSEALWYEPDSRNTAESAANCAVLLRQKGIQRILLVTSAFHMPRSVHLFEAQGLEVIPLPADFSITRSSEPATGVNLPALALNLFPTADNLALTTRSLKEYFGMLVYAAKGWK